MPMVLNKKANPMIKNNPKIPIGWSVKRFDEIGVFISGTGFPEKEQGGIEGIPFYKVSDMNLSENRIYMIKSNNYVTESQIKQMHIKPVLKKSILFAKVGAAIFLERKRIAENFLCDNNMMCFSPFDFSLFYKYYFDILRLSKYAQVGALPSYNASDLANIKILLPPLPEQEKIAEILGAWDLAIEKLEALIVAKRLRKKGLMQKLLTAKIRLPGFTDEWQKVKLGDFLEIKHGKNQKGIECQNGIFPILATGGKIGQTNTFIYNKPSILIGRKGTINKPKYIETPFWTIDTLFWSKMKNDNIAKFFYYLFQMIKWDAWNEGSTIPSLNASTIMSIKIKISDNTSEQKAIADILSKADEEIDLLTRKLDLLKSQKKGLMQQLLTGKIRVKVA